MPPVMTRFRESHHPIPKIPPPERPGHDAAERAGASAFPVASQPMPRPQPRGFVRALFARTGFPLRLNGAGRYDLGKDVTHPGGSEYQAGAPARRKPADPRWRVGVVAVTFLPAGVIVPGRPA